MPSEITVRPLKEGEHVWLELFTKVAS